MLQGIPVSPGLSVGRAVIVRFAGLSAFRRAIDPDELEEEVRRLRRAARKATEAFVKHSKEASGEIGAELAAILEAHGMIAADETYLQAIIERMRREKVNAEWALAEVSGELAGRLTASASDAMRDRAADIDDVAGEIGLHLSGGERPLLGNLPGGSILIADELTPVDAARVDPRRVRGLALERGGPTSHAAIIARSFGLPAVFGIPGLCEAVSPDRPVILDGDRGTVDPAPSKEKLRRTLLRIREAREAARRQRARTVRVAQTKDGVRIVVRANLEFVEEAAALERFHAEGVGLFRSEFLYLQSSGRRGGASVEEQRTVYEALMEAADGNPVVIRTYDLGGEKGIGPARGENPALGLRGLRYCLAQPEIFRTQLKALCLASRKGDLRIMLPMVSTLSEIREARQHLADAVAAVGLPRAPSLGIMVEVPSAALLADRLAAEVDFFSIGTNDLAQYALAVDRANPEVSPLYRPLHPAILRMIKFVVEAGTSQRRPVAVCGELAADPIGIAVLVGLGITEVSVTPVAIASVKDSVASVDSVKARALAERALNASEAAEVEKIFRGKS
jgi:phosphoenolpyruvate-protein phosphotransferase